ncbi:MalY/PatB family protein [Pseudoteredinibacter isoporae]|uniref:cysteine-S-conjugate beta-lyase n=1 Tax=Pseudoteredinibacter isoporae TaxID=570281 RepID=A0A7X0MZA2_9GAMM|nr:PatB family C-S lyase [Pseudoteredinibacter isoporae]MBB6522932.1 cystathionine beta-lyase [Pseudoteredinibacter isoporae]NHO88458.1 putative C-S lyase [Pseudoteredinibacter isoporae]NIB22145.1 putative C-S lyase [Pseudoteredinibacter isoporae]
MTSVFDTRIERDPKHSMKWKRYDGRDIIPCWVADMDFAVPASVQEAMMDFNQHGVYGYLNPEDYEEGRAAIVDWLEYRHGCRIPEEWIVWMPGVVPGFNIACRAFTEAGEGIVVQTPNYPPILNVHKNHQLESLTVPVVQDEHGPALDFERLSQQAASKHCKMMILCNPMNPNGKVLSKESLQQLADICEKNDLVLVSDEIHCDLILEPDVQHTPAFSLDSLQECSVTLMSAAKTFNIAGLGVSFGIIPNARLRRRFLQAANGLAPWANVLGLLATTAAFNGGREWHAELINYLRVNRDYLFDAVGQLPGLSMQKSEATFLAWLDARGLNADNNQQWFEERGVGPSPGVDFGAAGFARINFACPKSQLERIVERLQP